MKRRHWLSLAVLAMGPALLAAACARATPGPTPSPGYARPELLVSTDWLAEHLKDPTLRLLDARSDADYRKGHIAGAVFIDETLTWDRSSKWERIVGPPGVIQEVFRAAGVNNASRVVVYDDSGGLWAARIFWLLDYYGLQRISILNGGLPQWQAEGRPVTAEAPPVPPGDFTPLPQPEKLATRQYVLDRLGAPTAGIVDARSRAEYEGTDVRSQRGGHIPGARWVEWPSHLNPDGTFKYQQDLEKLYTAAGVTPDKEAIPYCQSGVRSAHTYFALRLIGYPRVRLYDASWEEWGNDPTAPVEKGPPPR